VVKLKIEELVEIFIEDLSPRSIMNNVSRISQYHRIQGSNGYLDAANYIKSVLEEKNIDSIIHEYPADGEWEKWGWVAPISWNIKSGECWLIKPVKKRICRFEDQPMCVLTHSNPASFTASVIDVGMGDKVSDYKEAKGKIALLTASPRRVFTFAAKNDVKGLLLYPGLERATQIGDSTVQYDGFWPIAESLPSVTSGFSISHKQAREIKHYLKSSDVQIQFKIDCNFTLDEGKLHVLEAEIKGSEDPTEEVVLIAHLCHPSPGANDNASGSATLLELLLSFNRMIKEGKFTPPKKTIKFLWVPEFSGTIAWMKRYDEERKTTNRKIMAVFNLDMVGESPLKIGTPLQISSPSLATPSYITAIVKYAAECVSKKNIPIEGRIYRLNFKMAPFGGGSDHMIFNDRYFGIPGMMFGHEDPFHHSSADSIDKVEPLECRSTGTIIGAATYGLACSDEDFLEGVSKLVYLEALDEQIRTELKLNQLQGLSDLQKLKFWELSGHLIEKQIKSLNQLPLGEILKADIDHFTKLVENHFNHVKKRLEVSSKGQIQDESGKMILQRNFEGPLSYKLLMKPDRSEHNQKKLALLSKVHWGGIILELFNLSDGKTPLEDIFLLLKIYYPDIPYSDIGFLVNMFLEEKMLTKIETYFPS
jgi:hypothetical protein